MDIKQQLYIACKHYIEQRIATIEKAIQSAREASTDDTKSSAGDKFETTREMMQQEIDRNSTQLTEALKLKQVLMAIKPDHNSTVIQPGSLAITNNGAFYIAISAGALTINGTNYFAVSSASPIGLCLMKLKKGDSFQFHGKAYSISDVY
ncbi:3-oxoacyl-ACP synthase [Solitalea koreensis]|uniref:Transcription elongation factor, GreA/GreB family n=1 Tax=Solitalea koreensis TaxID=543615 RepID=A0A521DIN3_9SPHI|nr:3-oxoacyl-ACP synthase [Solitalea koreensis]SMO71445.1 Transcription elongation factor, GreA/GreB family [Solitalea koreensis]